MTPSRDISRLLDIMAALRTPVSGCPWDLEQDFRSIVPYTVEEVYEVVDAIERDDMDDLREELGDLLLQVVYHARMAQEAEAFDFADVVEGVTRKMIRRHPHVFGDETARNAGMAKGTWERIKSQEKAERTARREALGLVDRVAGRSVLDDVPPAMEPMLEALKLQQKMARTGFDWNETTSVIAKIREELDEVEAEAIVDGSPGLEGEIGDLLFAVINLARHADIDPGNALRGCNRKVRRRFAYIEDNIGRTGKSLDAANLDEMEALWVEAKKT